MHQLNMIEDDKTAGYKQSDMMWGIGITREVRLANWEDREYEVKSTCEQ